MNPKQRELLERASRCLEAYVHGTPEDTWEMCAVAELLEDINQEIDTQPK